MGGRGSGSGSGSLGKQTSEWRQAERAVAASQAKAYNAKGKSAAAAFSEMTAAKSVAENKFYDLAKNGLGKDAKLFNFSDTRKTVSYRDGKNGVDILHGYDDKSGGAIIVNTLSAKSSRTSTLSITTQKRFTDPSAGFKYAANEVKKLKKKS